MLHDASGVPVYTHKNKECLLHEAYSSLLGAATDTTWSPDFNQLLPPISGLSDLESAFTVDEAKKRHVEDAQLQQP